MIKIVCTVVDLRTHEYKGYIRFDLDDDKGFCYCSRVSYDYFAHGQKQRIRKPGKFLYYCDHKHEMIKFNKIDSDILLVNVKNLWEFYKLIEYNYKKQKWI